MPDNANLKELGQEEYDLRQELGRLQRLIAVASDPDRLEELLGVRIEVEARLKEIQIQLAALSPDRKGAGTRSARKNETGVDIRSGMDYVPTSVYHLIDPAESALVIAGVTRKGIAPKAPDTVSVTSYIEGYSAHKVDVVTRQMTGDVQVRQSPTLLADRVRTITELTPATLHVEVHDFGTGAKIDHTTRTIWLLARNSVTTAVRDPETGTTTDLSRYLGAYVTPNAPAVMQFLRRVADHHPQHKLAGYQPGAPVEDQVRAVFDALKHDAQIVYVNSLVDFDPQEDKHSQRIRLPRESLAERQANCIDGTVLVASLLEAMSLTPAIVLVPKHAFVGWQVDKAEQAAWRYLETTLIDSAEFEHASERATRMAATYENQAIATNNSTWFRCLSLRELRAKHRVWPME